MFPNLSPIRHHRYRKTFCAMSTLTKRAGVNEEERGSRNGTAQPIPQRRPNNKWTVFDTIQLAFSVVYFQLQNKNMHSHLHRTPNACPSVTHTRTHAQFHLQGLLVFFLSVLASLYLTDTPFWGYNANNIETLWRGPKYAERTRAQTEAHDIHPHATRHTPHSCSCARQILHTRRTKEIQWQIPEFTHLSCNQGKGTSICCTLMSCCNFFVFVSFRCMMLLQDVNIMDQVCYQMK